MKDIDCDLYRKAVEQVARLNEKIRKDATLGKGFEIGQSYFSPANKSEINDDWFKNVIAFEIVPLKTLIMEKSRFPSPAIKPLTKHIKNDIINL